MSSPAVIETVDPIAAAALVVSVLSLLLSISNWIYLLVTQRRKLFLSVSQYHFDSEMVHFYLHVANGSRLPVSITRIRLLVGDKFFDCTRFPALVFEERFQSKGETYLHREHFSMPMPVSLDPLGAASGFVLVPLPQGSAPLPPTALTLEVSTNRGRPFRTTLSLDSAYLVP